MCFSTESCFLRSARDGGCTHGLYMIQRLTFDENDKVYVVLKCAHWLPLVLAVRAPSLTWEEGSSCQSSDEPQETHQHLCSFPKGQQS